MKLDPQVVLFLIGINDEWRTIQDYRAHFLLFYAHRVEKLVRFCRSHGTAPVLIT